MTEYLSTYHEWCAHPLLDLSLLQELAAIAHQPEEIKERFTTELTFGTGGMRGILGAGTGRINVQTVARATRGLARYLTTHFSTPSCAIAYDSRNYSKEFAQVTASILADCGIKVHLYSQLMPTPMLSFAVRELACSGGVVITASHNPAQYNGYKVYDSTGCQITDETAKEIQAAIREERYFGENQSLFDKYHKEGCISYIDNAVITAYYKAVEAQSVRSTKGLSGTLRAVYSPLHGAGAVPVQEILRRQPGTQVLMVKEQEAPDGNFPTAPYPNPETHEALALACEMLTKETADLAFATDPDCDRIGVAVRHNGAVQRLTGNEIGVLLLEYLCRERSLAGTLPQNPIAIKTIVTTEMAREITAHYGVELLDVLTGFKYIGEHIGQLETAGEEQRFLFGFEESCGYLSGSYVRDKDGVAAAYLLCEMAAHYTDNKMTLVDALEDLYSTYGYYQNKLMTFAFTGLDGMQTMETLLHSLRESYATIFPKEFTVEEYKDYRKPGTGLPQSNVLVFTFANQQHATVRPSGTEPQLKIYLSATAETLKQAEEAIAAMEVLFHQLVTKLS